MLRRLSWRRKARRNGCFRRLALRSRWTKHKIVSFSFSKLWYGPFGFNPENFANIWQIKWKWIRSRKFETVRIYFFSEFSVCSHPKILQPWQPDVKRLLSTDGSISYPEPSGFFVSKGWQKSLKEYGYEIVDGCILISLGRQFNSTAPR